MIDSARASSYAILAYSLFFRYFSRLHAIVLQFIWADLENGLFIMILSA